MEMSTSLFILRAASKWPSETVEAMVMEVSTPSFILQAASKWPSETVQLAQVIHGCK